MRRSPWSAAVVLACVLVPALASAQASITGSVKDATGAFLPGVTVEASSPVLIEKTRSVVTDGSGQYRIVDLRPGTYTVTFTLTGFNTFRRDGIQLTGSFTAVVDAELRLGSVQETITVSGTAPIVDVQTATQQRVMSKEIIDAIPAGRGQLAIAVLVPGMVTGGQDVGGQNTMALNQVAIHGGRSVDQRQAVDGLTIRNIAGEGWATNSVIDFGASQEMTIDYAAGNAEAATGGVLYNYVPREGGNRFTGSFFGAATNSEFQNDNFTPELRAQGLRAPNRLKYLHDYNGSVGGPIVTDRLWFFSSARFQNSQSYISGLWDNKNAGDLTKWNYEPGDQTFTLLRSNSVSTRLTMQLTPRNKVNVFWDQQYRHWDFRGLTNVSPESAQTYDFPRNQTGTVSWSSPVSNRLLLDVRGAIHAEDIRNFYPADPESVWRKLIGVVEQNAVLTLADGTTFTIPNLRYRGRANVNDTGIAANDQIESSTNEIKGSVSYVTGTHAFKFGMSNLTGVQTYNSPDSQTPYNYRFLNGVPNQLTLRQNQYFGIKGRVSPELAVFAQDKWTVDRLTLNLGLRYDHGVSSWDEFTFGPGILVPNRNITFPQTDWYVFNDLSPRIAGAYDLFGTGRTAVKVNIGKYQQGLLPTDGNPISTRMVNRVTRTWTDADNDLFPDCDLTNPQPQDLRAGGGDFCGVISDLRFGTSIPSTSYDEDTLRGWNKRKNNWEFSTSVQHEITTGLGIDVGYFRRWYGNFTVTQNRALTPADFTDYSIPVPVDPRLPNSGQRLGGLRDVVPGRFGLVDNYVTRADNFGKQTETFNGVDISANARLKGILFRGGISTGKIVSDVCDIVVAHPEVAVTTSLGAVQSIDMCHLETPFLTQAKLLATYSIPKTGVDVAATFQNLPGPQIGANYIATNAVIQPSLGRPLSGSTPNTTINLVAPGEMYGERLTQLDLRFTKLFRFSGRSVRANFDIYNATNGNTVRAVNNNYAAWLVPTGILDPRLFKISAQFDF